MTKHSAQCKLRQEVDNLAGDGLLKHCALQHPTTYGPPHHSGVRGELHIFNQPCGNLGPLGEIGARWLVHSHSRCSPSEEAVVFGAPLIFEMAGSELHIDLDQVEIEAAF